MADVSDQAEASAPARPADLRPASPDGTASTLAQGVVMMLRALGVKETFGVSGGGIVYMWDALSASGVPTYHCRHETGALFAACEASIAADRPVAVFVTTGPGLTNSLTGLMAARYEGAKVLLISGYTDPAYVGRFPIQETSPLSLPPQTLHTPNQTVQGVTILDSPQSLAGVWEACAAGFARSTGYVHHLALTVPAQRGHLPVPLSAPPRATAADTPALDQALLSRLAAGRCALWVGWGARRAAAAVAELSERLDAPVMSTPRGKGIFPEAGPRYLGVTGLGGDPEVADALRRHDPDFVIALGSRLGDGASCYDEAYLARAQLIQVDLAPDDLPHVYPADRLIRVEADVAAFAYALVEAAPAMCAPPTNTHHTGGPAPGHTPSAPPPRTERLVHPRRLLHEIQSRFVDRGDLVMGDNGNAFAWGNRYLRFSRPGQWRVSNLYLGSMGHFACGAVGAALATGRRAVALVGDGAMLMQNEVSTAVQYNASVVWIVLNDASYGMCRQGTKALGLPYADSSLPMTDFAQYAEALGARGIRVTAPEALHDALREAATVQGPCVVDVLIDPEALAPTQRRFAGLKHVPSAGLRH